MIKRGPRIGSPKHGGVDSGHFLRRKIGWTAEGFTWQHDPVHVKTLIEACLGDKKPTSRDISPSSKSVGKAVRDAADFLSFDETKEYQRLAATALYLAGDRLEIQNAVTILLRGMANPTKLHWLQLCRLASYLAAHPELELVYAYQELPSEVYAEVDADWAGCVETRRSTDGGFEFFGKCLIDGWSSTQQSIALSSGESELYGICNGSARILWTAHLLKEMGFHMKAVVATDSSAAKGVSSRLGAGRIRHLETRCLWIQERVRAKELEIRKVWTDKNRGDMQTKPLDPTRFWMLMGLLPLGVRRGAITPEEEALRWRSLLVALVEPRRPERTAVRRTACCGSWLRSSTRRSWQSLAGGWPFLRERLRHRVVARDLWMNPARPEECR